MADYRLFLMTAGDRIDRAIALTCDDDDQAIAEMKLQTVAGNGAELWQLARMVSRLAPVSLSGGS